MAPGDGPRDPKARLEEERAHGSGEAPEPADLPGDPDEPRGGTLPGRGRPGGEPCGVRLPVLEPRVRGESGRDPADVRRLEAREIGETQHAIHTWPTVSTRVQAAAEVFYMAHGESEDQKLAEAKCRDALNQLDRLGIRVKVDDKTVAKAVEIEKQMDKIGEQGEWTDKIAELEDVDFMVKQVLVHYAKVLSMSDRDFEEYLRSQKDLRDLLRSQTVEAPAP